MKTQPCEHCTQPVIEARTDKGRELEVNAEPEAGGKFALHDHGGTRMLATTPPAKLAFGRRLYIEHKCAGRAAAPRRRAAS